MILDRLVQYGYRTVSPPNPILNQSRDMCNIDFQPTRDTQRLLLQHSPQYQNDVVDYVLDKNQVYTWIGTKDKYHTKSNLDTASDQFGNAWPITKVRAMIPNTSPLELITFLFDSTQVSKYNSMSLGRDDLMVWHYDNIDRNPRSYLSTTSNSNSNLVGTVKIVMGRVQPKLFPKVIETLSIMYLTTIPDEPDSYMIVSRSIMEDETWDSVMIPTTVHTSSTIASSTSTKIRSEMLLNIYFVRPVKDHPDDSSNCGGGCELTTITHVVSTGVPEMIAKRMAPLTATTMVREIQRIFATNK
jgi:hypothetical protein